MKFNESLVREAVLAVMIGDIDSKKVVSGSLEN